MPHFAIDREQRDVVGPPLATVLHRVITHNVAKRRQEPLIVAIDELPTLYLPTLAEWLPSADMDLIVGGGATSMIREELKQFLDQQGLSHQLTWAESLRPEMQELV
jgi:hypothetical protein